MEPLAEAIRIDPLVTGIQVNSLQHKITLYADDGPSSILVTLRLLL